MPDLQLPSQLQSIATDWLIPTEGLRERTEYIDIFFFRPSLNRVLFLMFCLLVEWSVRF